jgi:hypothetical protein
MKYKMIPLGEIKDQLGFVYNEGPPHDHNWNWVDSRYLEEMHPSTLEGMDSDSEIRVLVEDDGNFSKFRGKLIIDTYLMLSEKSQVK